MPKTALAALALAAMLLPPPATAAEQWLKLKSAHFELYTCTGEKSGRDAILHFEQVRSFFLKLLGGNDTAPGAAVRIVAFDSEKRYLPYRASESAAAFYVGGGDRDYIVMGNLNSDTYSKAIHEYTHLITRHTAAQLPLWLNEGVAEVYSTMKQIGNKVQIGDVIPGHFMVLRDRKMLSVEALVNIGHDSPYYNERDRAGVFYSESWALTHMIMFSPIYRPRLAWLWPLLSQGIPAAEAFPKACGKSLDAVQADLQRYIASNQFFAALFDTKLEKAAEKPDVTVVPPLESRIVLAQILALIRKPGEARAAFETLARDYPKSWEVEAGLARFCWLERKEDEALRHFARAAELGSTDPEIYFDYGRLDNDNPRLLRRAIELKSDYQDAYYYLALSLVRSGDYEDALQQFKHVRNIKPAQAVSYFRAVAYASYRLGQMDQAKKFIAKAREWAKKPDEIAAVDDLARFIDTPPANGLSAMAATMAPRVADADRPRQRRPETETPEPAPNPTPGLESIEGTLLQLDCGGQQARLTLRTGAKQVRLAILDANNVVIKNADAGKVEFNCGPQKPRTVVIEFEPQVDSDMGTAGAIKSIEFK
jgi:hypothetical protein